MSIEFGSRDFAMFGWMVFSVGSLKLHKHLTAKRFRNIHQNHPMPAMLCLILYAFGHEMPKPCRAIGTPQKAILSIYLVHTHLAKIKGS